MASQMAGDLRRHDGRTSRPARTVPRQGLVHEVRGWLAVYRVAGEKPFEGAQGGGPDAATEATKKAGVLPPLSEGDALDLKELDRSRTSRSRRRVTARRRW